MKNTMQIRSRYSDSCALEAVPWKPEKIPRKDAKTRRRKGT